MTAVEAAVILLNLATSGVVVLVLRREVDRIVTMLSTIRERLVTLKADVAEVDAMVSDTRHNVNVLVKEANNRRTQWESELAG